MIRLGESVSFSEPIRDLSKVFYAPHFHYMFRGPYPARSSNITIFLKFVESLFPPTSAINFLIPPRILHLLQTIRCYHAGPASVLVLRCTACEYTASITFQQWL